MEIRTLFSCGHSEWIPLDNVNNCKCSKCDTSHNGLRAEATLEQQGQVENSHKSPIITIAEDGSSPVLENNEGQDRKALRFPQGETSMRNSPETLMEELTPALQKQELIEKLVMC